MKKIYFLFLFLAILYNSVYSEDLQDSPVVINSTPKTISNIRDTLRGQPLPFLDLESSIESGKLLLDFPLDLPVKQQLSPGTTEIIKNIVKNIYKGNSVELKPEICPEDLVTSENSEEYQLKRILESDFKEQNWGTAYNLITNFLRARHSKAIKTKAHFYMAQVLFFQNKYKDSFMEFTLVQDQMPIKSKKWMDALLNYLQEEK